ncbi:MAG: Tex family protein [Eubacteriales bacterium]|nr:Tex family protein [Eubacteriales bacterium]MDD4421756.1 Tex family protein [Eubacteriales bacterium]
MDIIASLAEELKIRYKQVEDTVKLIDEGNTIPFIARYRKEITGSLDDGVLRELGERLAALRAIEERRCEVRRLIDEQGKLTEDIEKALDAAKTVAEIDDIYRPYRPKRRTRATMAVEAGLTPLAELILEQNRNSNITAEAEKFLNPEKNINSAEDAIAGAMDIIAERVSDNAEFRKWIRDFTFNKGNLVSKAKTDQDSVYRLYYDYNEDVRKMPSHRVLAVNRGEKEDFLTVKIEVDKVAIIEFIQGQMLSHHQSPSENYIKLACEDAYDRLIAPSVQTEIRNMITATAEEQATKVFGENLKNLLLTPPIRDRVVMGFDPAYRTGCKIAVVNDVGDVLATTVVYPTPPQNRKDEAEKVLTELINKYNVDIISIGNGTASKESEIFVCDLIKKQKRQVSYIMTSEAGASVYSASKLASEEFPQFDVSLRSAVSIARRIQDPLAELVKIDPKAIGVGQYQHDMNPKALSASLAGVVESCVSNVGADLNTASVSLLSHIAGINAKTAQNIYDYRTSCSRFKKRSELLKVKGIGEKAYTQCAGFLRVPESKEVLDNTAVHPESYDVAKKLLTEVGYNENDVREQKINEISERIEKKGLESLAKNLGIGVPTLLDIVSELKKPGRDPRSELPPQILRTDAMDIKMLKPGMEFMGTVRNVADFGAFVDIGVHQDGLVHISKLSKGFVKRAMDAASVGDIIKVRVLDVDVEKKRISLEKVFEK